MEIFITVIGYTVLACLYFIIGGFIDEKISPDSTIDILGVIFWPVVVLGHLGGWILEKIIK